MASIRELKTKWQIRYRDRSREPEWAYDSLEKEDYTRAQAEDEASFRQQLYDRRQYDPWVQPAPGAAARSKPVTLKEAVDTYVEEKRKAGERGETGGWGEKTYTSDAPILRKFARDTGPNILLENLSQEHLQQWVYEESIAEATRRGRWIRLRAMVSWWEDHGWLTEPPSLPGKPEKRRRIRVTLTPDQLGTVCTAYQHLRKRKIAASKHTNRAGVDWHPDAWRLAFYQGLRRSELLELRIRNVLLEEGMLQIGDREFQQKGKRESLIPIVGPARPILKEYIGGRPRDERLFSTPSTNDRVSRHFREAVDHATLTHKQSEGLSAEDVPFTPLDESPEEVDFYTLRHSCCTHWLRQRRRLIWVNHLMRHQSIQTTMGYVHLLPTDLRTMYLSGENGA